MNVHTKTKLAKQFDTPDTLLVVSLYPKKGETYSKGTTGVASYTKNLVTNMRRPVVVLANSLGNNQSYQEENTLVKRCFTPNTLSMWKELFNEIRQFKHAKKVLIQFDFSMYGSMIVSGLILPFIGLLRLLGYEVSVVSHHVIQDVNKLSGHLGLNSSVRDRIKAKLYNFIFATFYQLLGVVTTSVIVLEETLKATMSQFMSLHKVVAIPHAVDTTVEKISKKEARKKLGFKQKEHVVMFFGFVNWFKGADFFAEAFQDVDSLNDKSIRFVIAGGESATLKDKNYYKKYYQSVQSAIENSHRVEMTGYVPQEKIKEYFAAADLVVFPYRHFMCASGVLSLAFSYTTPFIVSDQLTPMFQAPDLSTALVQAGVQSSEISFALTKRDTIKVTEKVLENGLKKKLVKAGGIVKHYRSYANNAKLYEHALFTKNVAQAPKLKAGKYAYIPTQ